MTLRRAILAAISVVVLLLSGTAFAADASGPVITEPADNYQSVYDFINSATTSLDMTMYELVDTTAEQDLANLAAKGVKVRVILDQNREKSSNTSAYNFLSGNGVDVVWADTTYAATHQKTITVDDKTSRILTGNLTSRYYSTTRDFGVVDTDAADVSAIETVFNADFADKSVTPGAATTSCGARRIPSRSWRISSTARPGRSMSRTRKWDTRRSSTTWSRPPNGVSMSRSR